MRLRLPSMGSPLLPAMNVLSPFAGLVMSTRGVKGIRPAHSVRPDTNASKVRSILYSSHWIWLLDSRRSLIILPMNELQVVPELKVMKMRTILMIWTMSLIMILMLNIKLQNHCFMDALTLAVVPIPIYLASPQIRNMDHLLSILKFLSWLTGRRYISLNFPLRCLIFLQCLNPT